jgi:hypothetical protein
MAEQIFRLKNTPLGTVLVKFYQVVPYSSEAFERHLITEHLGRQWGKNQTVILRSSKALYQGLVLNNTVLIGAVAKLAERCPACNCLRIEQEVPGGMTW